VNLALEKFGQPLYVRREIVHNKYVVNELRQKGTIFVDEIDEVPVGGRVIFSAHGVSPDVREMARQRQLRVIDATCPLVTKVHHEAIRYSREGYTVILIGHEDHDEVIGTTGEAPGDILVIDSAEGVDSIIVHDPSRVAYLTQTTLSLNDTRAIITRLRERFPKIKGPSSEDICYATQNRQGAVLELAQRAEVILVVGSANSSNSCRLVEVARSTGIPAYLIDDIDAIRLHWLESVRVVGLTAGASAPEGLVERVIRYLKGVGYPHVEIVGSIVEDVEFALPLELRTGAEDDKRAPVSDLS
jgi:4-hydroxy-3-methylbut-2-enyl diphosphate reductase